MLSDLSEKALIERAKQLDKAALEELYHRHYDNVYRYVFYKLGNKADTEDVTGEVFLRMIDSLPSFRWKGVSFSAWLYRIAHNLIVDLLRRRSSRAIETLESVEEVASGSDIEEELLGRMEEEDLRQAIFQLPERYREVIYLKFQQDLSNREVAVIMNMSPGAVNSLRFRAVRALGESLAGRDEK